MTQCDWHETIMHKVSATRFFPDRICEGNSINTPCSFQTHLPIFWVDFFSETLAISCRTSYEFLTPC